MDKKWYDTLIDSSLAGKTQPLSVYHDLLTSSKVELLKLLDAAFAVREHFHGRSVTIHIINNAQNGLCSEDCSYCAQAKTSKAPITKYMTKSDDEIINEAQQAYEAGAHRYCMVYAGRRMDQKRLNNLCSLIQTIKQKYPIEVCVSAGLVDEPSAVELQKAGLDRLNHNLNTSASHYSHICTTHTFEDRLNTLQAAKNAGLEVCSGIIAGMGESEDELIELAMTLKNVNARSIPINFLLPIPGNTLSVQSNLSPEYCLKILCLFRFVNPDAEIRIAAGREYHLRSMEAMALFPANSLFMDGYLNTKGNSRRKTLEMIRDAGFTIESDKSIDDLLQKSVLEERQKATLQNEDYLKSEIELRPGLH